MAEFLLSRKAQEDLAEIWNYTVEEWSEAQADMYYLMLIEACEELASGRVKGKPYPEVHQDICGYKTGEHIIFYKKGLPDNLVVIRFLHSRMDLRSRISE